MNCQEAARHLPGYLDGAIEFHTHHGLRQHLESCHDCRGEADRYRLMSRALANLEAMPVPPDLALKIRIHASKASPVRSFARRARTQVALVFGNILAPIALPATGGVLATVGVFVLLLQNLLVGVPMGSMVANDLQINLVQPAYLESLGPIPAPTFDMGLTLDATVNAQGQAVDYKIISGPTDSDSKRQIDQVMLLSHFRPRLNDGRPTSGGHVVLNFNSIRVKG
jgi:anti-sigma factor RsiW